MAGVADQDQGPALRHVALALVVDLGHQRAGGVEYRQAACGGFLFHAPRHAMGAEYGDGLRRDLGKVLDEDRPLVFQAFDHVFVVNDLMPHIDRRAILLERALDDFDRAHDARAKAAWLRQIDFHWTAVTQIELPSFWRSVRSGRRPTSVMSALQYPPTAFRRVGARALCQKKTG